MPDLTKPNQFEFHRSRIGSSVDESVLLAVSVLRSRISQLPREDQDNLWKLFPYINSEDEEERDAACTAMMEILEQEPLQVHSVDLNDDDDQSLNSWLSYVSARIKSAREEASLTQSELASKSQIPQSHISRLERGQHSPTAKTLERIASALGKPPSYFDPSAED